MRVSSAHGGTRDEESQPERPYFFSRSMSALRLSPSRRAVSDWFPPTSSSVRAMRFRSTASRCSRIVSVTRTRSNGHTCQGCQANAALKQGTSVTFEGDYNGKRIRGYWIPLKDSTEVYVHGYTTVGAALAVVE